MDEVAKINLEKPLLLRASTGSHLSVNFDPQVEEPQPVWYCYYSGVITGRLIWSVQCKGLGSFSVLD